MLNEAKRKRRSRVACEPCQTRKRKCNGQQPCDTCIHFDYRCSYNYETRKKRNKHPSSADLRAAHLLKVPQPAPHSDSVPSEQVDEPSADAVQESIGSNSGAVLTKSLGLKSYSHNTPDLRIFAWNIGARQLPGCFAAKSVVDIISMEEMSALAQTFFDKVAPYYGFVDRDSLFENILSRWNRQSSFEPFDIVLCGVAAIAFLFSSRKAVAAELHLVESLRSSLELYSVSDIPSVVLVTGWALRLAYLRLTASPHTAWLASCSVMHLIDAAGLHLNPSSRHALLRPSQYVDEDIRRRLVGYARYINTWVSFDLARSRIILQGASYDTPSTQEGDFTAEMLGLLPLSENLDVYTPTTGTKLTEMLVTILGSSRTEAPSVLSQCNLVLCIYRRLRAVHTSLSAVLMRQMLALITRALAGARELVDSNCPWAHVANVPFQIICTLLAVDTSESLALLVDAVQTLKYVAYAYDTEVLRDAHSAARSLIVLQQKRKEQDACHLNNILSEHFAHPASSDEMIYQGQDPQDFESSTNFPTADFAENFDFTRFFIADSDIWEGLVAEY